jgi:hypothetical protein
MGQNPTGGYGGKQTTYSDGSYSQDHYTSDGKAMRTERQYPN